MPQLRFGAVKKKKMQLVKTTVSKNLEISFKNAVSYLKISLKNAVSKNLEISFKNLLHCHFKYEKY